MSLGGLTVIKDLGAFDIGGRVAVLMEAHGKCRICIGNDFAPVLHVGNFLICCALGMQPSVGVSGENNFKALIRKGIS